MDTAALPATGNPAKATHATPEANSTSPAAHGYATGIAGTASVWLRPPAHADLPAIAAMWQRCSTATRTARFHAPVRTIPAAYLDTLLADPVAGVVAAQPQTHVIVAVASLVPAGDGSAELGVLVEDAWQRRGIGRRLLTHLLRVAATHQISVLTASVLTDHVHIARLLRRVPGQFSLTVQGPTLTVVIGLAP